MASLKISLPEEMLETRLLMFSGMFFYQCGGIITLLVDVQQFVVGFHVRFIASACKVQGHIKEVHGLFICFNCDLETMRFENIANFLFCFLDFPWSCFAYCEAVITIESHLIFKFGHDE